MDDLIQMGKLAQQASRQLAQLSTARKNEILKLKGDPKNMERYLGATRQYSIGDTLAWMLSK